MIQLDSVTKVYSMGSVEVNALRGIDLKIEPGEFIAIMGPSGSGKSTLMNILGCLDQPSGGSYRLDGLSVAQMNDDQLAEVRNRKIGFVFQNYNLLARTSAIDNVEIPMVYAGVSLADRHRKAVDALKSVGLAERLHHKPNQLSGGEQQRVAIARSLVNEPSIILADEPTGNLDSRTGREIISIFQHLNRDRGMTIIFVTHDPEVAACTRRIVRLRDGLVVGEELVNQPCSSEVVAGPESAANRS
ncbi:MAG TPA: ABC transporter ATP-binding protein [Anaerolineae bacterium]|nr:ABC transporter ATP-binding protein [Anaerolineae bacterium]HQJ51604.1 ABC transporter ATP-binding protein [Anaerolineae bacterium]